MKSADRPVLGVVFVVASFAVLGISGPPAGSAGVVPFSSAPSPHGALFAWGDDDAGQLGIGAISDAANHYGYDAAVPEWTHMPAGTQTMGAAGGQSHTLILTTSGAVYATGYNQSGQLGDGSVVATVSPVQSTLPAGVTMSAVAAGYKQSMALSAGGVVYTWGKNDDGQGGIGNEHNILTPAAVSLPGVATAIAAGANHDLAVTAIGAVLDWGLNSTGQLGDDSVVSSDLPVQAQLPGGVVAKAVAGAAGHSLALTTTGKVYAWGDNSHGQLGDGNYLEQNLPVPVDLPSGVVVRQIAAGDGSDNGLEGGYSLALTSTGAIYAWGDNASGDLGDDTNANSDVPVLVQVPSGVTPVAISAGGNRCHLLSTDGSIYDWGANEQFGHDVHLTPVVDTLPAGMTPVAIADGPVAEQYLTVLRGSSLSLSKSSTSTYSRAGKILSYTYGVTDTGTTTLRHVSVVDNRVKPADLTCPQTVLTLGEMDTCTGTYTTTEANVTSGSVTNSAVADAESPAHSEVQSNSASFKVKAS